MSKEKDPYCECGNKKTKPSYKRCGECFKKYRTSAEYKDNMSKACKGKSSWCKGLTKETSESLQKTSEAMKNKTPWNKGKRLTEEQKEKYTGRQPWNKGKKMSKEFCEKQKGRKHTDETKEKIRNKLLERINHGEINGSPKCKIYTFKGIKVQGRSELKWIKENYDKVINTKKKAVKTPLGVYFPDFETEEAYIEVKSSWTYEKMLEEKNKNNSQYKKIQYVSKHIKPVKIYIDAGVDWAMKISDKNGK
jgi:hypothetical protein